MLPFLFTLGSRLTVKLRAARVTYNDQKMAVISNSISIDTDILFRRLNYALINSAAPIEGAAP